MFAAVMVGFEGQREQLVYPERWHVLVTLVLLLVFYAALRWRRRRRGRTPGVTVAGWLRGGLAWRLTVQGPVYVMIAMVVLGPSRFADHELRSVLVYGAGAATIVWLAFGGTTAVGRRLGLLVPADAVLQRRVDVLAERAQVAVRRVWILRTDYVNALALPVVRDLLFTERLLAELDEHEVDAITLHELGHLRQARGVRSRVLVVTVLLVTCGMMLPLADLLGAVIVPALAFGCVVFARHFVAAMHRDEVDADAHASAHVEHEAVYARALEHLHRCALLPAVLAGRQIHPNLYDRMQSAGVTPDYPRPAPPQRLIGSVVLHVVLAIAFVVLHARVEAGYQSEVFEGEPSALMAVVWTQGGPYPVAALGYHWQHTRPDDALTALDYAADLVEPDSEWLEDLRKQLRAQLNRR